MSKCDAKWYALYTKSQHEKKIENDLLMMGIEAFTPKVKIRKKWSDRMKTVETPLFKSYCFAKFPIEDRIKILKVKGIVNIVKFKDHYSVIPLTVINSLKILTSQNANIDPYPYLKEGKRIYIKRGPLKGVEGFIIEKREQKYSLVVSVDAIASSIKCIVDVDDVEPV